MSHIEPKDVAGPAPGPGPNAEERARLRAMAQERLREREARLQARADREAREARQAAEREAKQAAQRAGLEAKQQQRQARVSARLSRKVERETAAADEAGKRRTICIHIGLKKSGSASIQSFITANEERLAELGLNYPKAGRGPFKDHHNLNSELQERVKFDPEHGSLDDVAFEIRVSDAKTHLLSSEMFEGCKPAQIAQLKEALDHGRGRYRIILVIRELVDIMPSSYAQKVKLGAHDYDFDTFFEQRMEEARTDYFTTARRWAAVFGWASLRVRLLDASALVNGDLIDDFLATLGFEAAAPEFRDLERPGTVNISPGWRLLEAVRGFVTGRHCLPPDHPLRAIKVRRIGPDTLDLSLHRKRFGTVAMKVASEMGWNADRGLYLTTEQAERCVEAYRRTVEQFNAVLTTPLPPPRTLEARGFRPRSWTPDIERIEPRQLRAFYDRMGKLLMSRKAL